MFVEVVSPEGRVIVSSRAVAASPQSNFEALLGAAMSSAGKGAGKGAGGKAHCLARPSVRVSKGGRGSTAHQVDLDTLVSAASSAHMSFVRVLLTPEKSHGATSSREATPVCAFGKMMGAAGHCSDELRLPAAKENARGRGDLDMYNLIIENMRSLKLGVKTESEAQSGLEELVAKLQDALWYADMRHRELSVPAFFSQFMGHIKLARKKKRRASMEAAAVEALANALEGATMQQCFQNDNLRDYMEHVRGVVAGFRAHVGRANEQRLRSAADKKSVGKGLRAGMEAAHQEHCVVANSGGFSCSGELR
jgi:hypothetical protein